MCVDADGEQNCSVVGFPQKLCAMSVARAWPGSCRIRRFSDSYRHVPAHDLQACLWGAREVGRNIQWRNAQEDKATKDKAVNFATTWFVDGLNLLGLTWQVQVNESSDESSGNEAADDSTGYRLVTSVLPTLLRKEGHDEDDDGEECKQAQD